MDHLGEKLKAIRDIMAASYDFDEFVVMLLGDVNDGTGIYATQSHHQAETNVEEQAEQLTDYLSPWFKKQRDIWGKVRIECVPGNHGRAGKFAHEAANWDIVAYKYLKSKLSGHCRVEMPRRGNKFLRVAEVKGHRYLIYHGHDIRSFGNIPWYGISLRLARWHTTKLAPFAVSIMGHFHTCGDWPLNQVNMLLTGTMVSDDEWALQSLGWESVNRWWLFGVGAEHPMTWQFKLEV